MATLNESLDLLFHPDTVCVASISYGKDSLAMLRAIKLLGLPLHRIVHSEVWATPTIPADLPPMVEFKRHADKIIKDLYGIEVEHICATRPSQNGNVERERERELRVNVLPPSAKRKIPRHDQRLPSNQRKLVQKAQAFGNC